MESVFICSIFKYKGNLNKLLETAYKLKILPGKQIIKNITIIIQNNVSSVETYNESILDQSVDYIIYYILHHWPSSPCNEISF